MVYVSSDHTECKADHSECVKQLKNLIQRLPEENYMLLQYIISFLVKVSKYEDTNKMSSQALAIVFGPNLFRYTWLLVLPGTVKVAGDKGGGF